MAALAYGAGAVAARWSTPMHARGRTAVALACALVALVPFWAWLRLKGSPEADAASLGASSSRTLPFPAAGETRPGRWVAMTAGAILILALLFGAAFLSMTALSEPRPFPSALDSARLRWALIVTLCPLALAATLTLVSRFPRATGALLAACTSVAACVVAHPPITPD